MTDHLAREYGVPFSEMEQVKRERDDARRQLDDMRRMFHLAVRDRDEARSVARNALEIARAHGANPFGLGMFPWLQDEDP